MTQPLSIRDDDYVPTLERAACRNYLDAISLLRTHERRFTAVYLFGYSVEMRVKAAYFRTLFHVSGLATNTRIDSRRRTQELNQWSTLQLPNKPGPHDIAGWAHLLVNKRAMIASSTLAAYPPKLATEIRNRADAVYAHWRECSRYRMPRIHDVELGEVREHARWFDQNYSTLHP